MRLIICLAPDARVEVFFIKFHFLNKTDFAPMGKTYDRWINQIAQKWKPISALLQTKRLERKAERLCRKPLIC